MTAIDTGSPPHVHGPGHGHGHGHGAPAEPAPSARMLPLGETARMLRPVHAQLITCALLSGVAGAAGMVPFVAIAEIARAAFASPAGVQAVSGTIWTWVVAGAACALLRLVLLGLSTHVGHNADADMLNALRHRIVKRLGVLPLGWFRAAGSGRVKRAMTDDLEEMHELFAHALGSMTGAAGAVAVGVGYLFSVDWRMALVTIAVPALGILSYRLAMRSTGPQMTRLIVAEGRISAATVEYVDGIGVVKTFGGTEGRVLARFAEALDEHTAAYRDWVSEVRTSSAISRVLGSEMTILGVVMAAGLAFVAAGGLGPAELLPFLAVGVGLPTSLNPLVHGGQGIRVARRAAGHIAGLLSRAPLPEATTPRTPLGNRLEFADVSFSYGGTTEALSGVSAVCEPGTVTAVVGPSGAGKTTLASLVPRFYDVTGGSISIGGVDIRDISSERLLSSMALVFQDVALLRDTVTENIRIGRPGATPEEVRQAAKAAQVHHVVERLPQGYDTVLEGSGAGLSGGERQRLTIARAILADAPIVVLDEATASLDPDSETAVQDALAELVSGKTLIVIAHRLHTIAGADQILVLDGGRLVESGTHRELLARDGRYTRMWQAQQNGDSA
ncbi:ABC transporter ATP-binding protein [Actinosynnema sp. NPDC023587]|uniref:ABC transporter ATP-binding protein n=1 Tax=Actinosynnema sp. NPDC023587 TaxID=3154695 RepID=UPI0033D5248B